MVASDPYLLYTATTHVYGDPSASRSPHAASNAIPLLSDFSCNDPVPSLATSSDPGNLDVDDIFVWNALSQHFGENSNLKPQHTTNFPMPKEPQILLLLGTSPPFCLWQTKQPYLLADTNLTPKCHPTRPIPTKDQLPFSNHVVCGSAPNPPCNSTWIPTQSTPQRTPMPSYSQKT